MIRTVEEFIKKNIKNDEPIVVGVSTGIDSMVLLDILQKLTNKIIVAHVNHGRREQSKTEEVYISNYCHEHNLELRIKRFINSDFENGNFQETARQYRYDFFKDVADEFNSKYLCLAHHLNDDIETMIMRIIRGSSLRGYGGINEIQEYKSMIVLRPLLKIKKEDIIKYANEFHIKYFDDESNDDDAYTRNQIRHHIIPELKNINEQFYLQFQEFKDNIISSADTIQSLRDEFIDSKVVKGKESVEFKRTDFNKLTPYLQVEVLFELVKSYKFSKANINELIKLINSRNQNQRIIYKGLTFIKEYNDISIQFFEKEKQDIHIVIDGIGVYPINEKYHIEVSKKLDNKDANLMKLWYNSSKLPIVARTRMPGDKIVFDYGTKKVKKILIDAKVGITTRDEVIILEKDGEILSVMGYAKSSKLKDKEHNIIIELKENKDVY